MVNIFTIFIKYCENETIRYIFKNNYKNTLFNRKWVI